MKRPWILSVAVLGLCMGGVAYGQTDGVSADVSAQAAYLGAPVASARPPKVLVIPFTALNVPEGQQWVATAVQEVIVADLGRAHTYSPVAFQGQIIVEDNGTAARLAKLAGAPLVVRGAVQAVGDQVRLTAQMIDSHSMDTVATASVTGPGSDLLKLEDTLSAQLLGNSQADSSAVAAQAPGAGVQGMPTINVQPGATLQIVIPGGGGGSYPASGPVYASDTYPASYPASYPAPYDYGYGYPYYGGGYISFGYPIYGFGCYNRGFRGSWGPRVEHFDGHFGHGFGVGGGFGHGVVHSQPLMTQAVFHTQNAFTGGFAARGGFGHSVGGGFGGGFAGGGGGRMGGGGFHR